MRRANPALRALAACLAALLVACACSRETNTSLRASRAPASSERARAAAPGAAGPVALAAVGVDAVVALFAESAAPAPAPSASAAAMAPRPARALPYARPDLSDDPAERERARLLLDAAARHDFKTANQLANTEALRQLYDEQKEGQRQMLGAEQATASADRERSSAREP